MLVAAILLLGCELELTITAGAIGRGLRRSHPATTALATLGVAFALAAAVLALWALWFVAPACVAGDGCAPPAATATWFAAGLLVQWCWLLAAAFAGRASAWRRIAGLGARDYG